MAQMELMIRIASVCTAGEPSEELYRELLNIVREAISFDAATLYLLDSAKGRLEAKASLGDKIESLSFLEFYNGEGLTGWTAKQKRSLLLRDRSSRRNFDPETDYATFLSVPLRLNDSVYGVINFGCRQPQGFDDADVRLATTIGSQIALGIELVNRRQECLQLNSELEVTRKRLAEEVGCLTAEAKQRVGQEISLTYNEINNFLAVIVGNMECLIAENAMPTQKSMSRLRRTIEAATKLRGTGKKILKTKRLIGRCPDMPGEKGLAEPETMATEDV